MYRKILFFVIIFLVFSNNVAAADYKTDYEVQYFLNEKSNSVDSLAKFFIKITNLRSNVYVKKYSISFPRSFNIKNVTAKDDKGPIQAIVIEEDKSINITLEFADPNTGKNSENNFFLEFNQDNLFKINGNVWEVILPTIEKKDETGNYKIIVNLPNSTNKKISIAKPLPDHVSYNQIIWNNPKTRTIYAVFGESQYFQTELIYHLKNPQIVPVYTEVAYPPDTLYQKIFVNEMIPKPSLVYVDEDGNYIGRYFLNPKEIKIVVFKGVIQVFAKPRNEMIPVIQMQINTQKKYLLSESKYWKLSKPESFGSVKSVQEIYSLVTNTLQYNYKKIGNTNNERIGAEKALQNPDQSVCVEYSDLFIALARENGIYSREIQGFGFSQDPELRPLSLTSDILHSWPEYYDTQKKTWISIDPTWDDTSGIDYLTSFDLNHIVFAIHGKRPDYPLSAGMYKLENSQDIIVKAIQSAPQDKIQVLIESSNFPSQINDKDQYDSQITIKNNSNVFLTNVPIKINAPDLKFQQNIQTISLLAPMESRIIKINYQAKNKNIRKTSDVDIFIYDERISSSSIKIVPYLFDIVMKTLILFGILIFFYIVIKIILKRNKKS